MMSKLRDVAYRIDPALWVRQVLGVEPAPWQEQFLRAPLGASIIVLTARQVGKTTAAAWAVANYMLNTPGGLSVIACPSQRQSAEAVRRIHDILIKVGAGFRTDNVYALELKNQSRVLALPGSDDSIRGLTVDGWIVADEAAQLSNDLIAALSPMRARRPQARFAMLSTAWSRTDPFWTVWADDDPSWMRLKATADTVNFFTEEYLKQQRRLLGEHNFNREYLGIPLGATGSPFSWDLYVRATQIHVPLVQPGAAFQPPTEAPAVRIPNPFQRLTVSGAVR
jgi:Terminase large subunit, T4likevirus-type, N-terminal